MSVVGLSFAIIFYFTYYYYYLLLQLFLFLGRITNNATTISSTADGAGLSSFRLTIDNKLSVDLLALPDAEQSDVDKPHNAYIYK